MKPSALFEALHTLIGQRVPLHIWGACGSFSTVNEALPAFTTLNCLETSSLALDTRLY